MQRVAEHSTNYSERLLTESLEVWQPYSEGPLTVCDAIEIIDNVSALFELLVELEAKYAKAQTDI